MASLHITASELRELVKYDPDTGVFTDDRGKRYKVAADAHAAYATAAQKWYNEFARVA